MRHTLAYCAFALVLSACATRTPVDVPPVAAPCPAEGLAEVRPEPVHPLPDSVELGVVFGAVATALGEERAQALVRFWETEVPTWGRQLEQRAKVIKTWCEAR